MDPACIDGSCDTGDNCPLLAQYCPDNVCRTPTCANGCGETAIINAEDAGQCDATNQAGSCISPPCVCDESGTCIDRPCGNGTCDYPTEDHLTCPADCTTYCGDGVITSLNSEGVAEVCDGINVGARTCLDEGLSGVSLSCVADCLAFDISNCSLENCCNEIDDDSDGVENGKDNDCTVNQILDTGTNTICWWTEWPYSNNSFGISGAYACPVGEVITEVNYYMDTEPVNDVLQVMDATTYAVLQENSGNQGTVTAGPFTANSILFFFMSNDTIPGNGVKINTITCGAP